MVHIHSIIRVLFTASLAVLTSGVSATNLNIKRSVAPVEGDIREASTKLTTWSGTIQTLVTNNNTSLNDSLAVHNAATDLVCSVSKASTSIWFVLSADGESDARDIIALVIPMRETLLQALNTITANRSIFDIPSAPWIFDIVGQGLTSLSISVTVFMRGVVNVSPDDLKLEATYMSDDIVKAFKTVIAAFAGPNSTVVQGGGLWIS